MDDFLQDLNVAQKQAVEHTTGPLLIVAGAGTGKTTVITQRIVNLIEKEKAKPEEILAVTFTEKAAFEMEERIDKLLEFGYLDLWVSTFHSFCERVLRENALDIGLGPDFKILDNTASWLLARQNLDKFDLNYYKSLGNPTKFIQATI
jgi:DNA helicase-2/ATP-dependent DNA helicase PcrA